MTVESADLIAAKTGGRTIALILTFIVALERSPFKGSIEYDYVAKSQPWNEIFDADLAALDSQRQRQIVLAMAHSQREVVREDEIIEKVLAVMPGQRGEVFDELKRLDTEKGLILRNDGFVSFVHSGFAIFVDNKYSAEYSRHWGAIANRESTTSEAELVQSLSLLGSMSAGLIHVLRNRLQSMVALTEVLGSLAKIRDLDGIESHVEKLKNTIDQMDQAIRDFTTFARPVKEPANSSAVLVTLIREQTADSRVRHPDMKVVLVDDGRHADGISVTGDGHMIGKVFQELLSNASASATGRPVTVHILVNPESSLSTLICEVADWTCPPN